MNLTSPNPARRSGSGLEMAPAQRAAHPHRARHTLAPFATFCSVLLACGCSRPLSREGRAQERVEAKPEPAPKVAPVAARTEVVVATPSVGQVENIPVPPADGPLLAPLVLSASIYARPERAAERIGYLRLGARIARSQEPVSLRDCSGGWYAVRPVGFVCAGDEVSLSLEHPVVRALQTEPNRERPLPYPYAFVRAEVPNYLKVPSSEEQFTYEPGLARHLRDWRKLSHEWDALSVGANAVPLGVDGAALGPIPEHAQPLDMSARYGGDGSDRIPWWLGDGERKVPIFSGFQAPPTAVVSDRIQPQAGVALIGSFIAGEGVQERRFAITTDARLLPADKLRADAGSRFHGASVRGHGLPAAFVRKGGVSYWEVENGKLAAREPLEYRQFVALTGQARDVKTTRRTAKGPVEESERLLEAKAGGWLRARDLKMVNMPRTLPWFAERGSRWIDVSIDHQTLVLWEGSEPVYATLVSTGRDGTGDPEKTWSTPSGTFRIQQKHVTATMDSRAADSEFELRDVPWVMYFQGGYALHGAYWHDDFGRPRSHGCVNLSPIDARYVFEWSLPDVPQHWHGAYSSDTFGSGTLIRIGP
jgi:hypothetical protein